MLLPTRVDVLCPISDSTPYAEVKQYPILAQSSKYLLSYHKLANLPMSIPCPEKNLLRLLHVLHPPNRKCWFAGDLHSLTIFRSEFGYVKRRYTMKILILFFLLGQLKR